MLVNCFLGNNVKTEFHVLVVFQVGVETHVADDESHEFGVRCGDDTIEQDFGSGETCYFSCDVSKMIKQLTLCGDADAIHFILFRFFVAHDSWLSDPFIFRNHVFRCPEACVGAFHTFDTVLFFNALKETPKFIACSVQPSILESWMFDQLSMFELFAHFFVKH